MILGDHKNLIDMESEERKNISLFLQNMEETRFFDNFIKIAYLLVHVLHVAKLQQGQIANLGQAFLEGIAC